MIALQDSLYSERVLYLYVLIHNILFTPSHPISFRFLFFLFLFGYADGFINNSSHLGLKGTVASKWFVAKERKGNDTKKDSYTDVAVNTLPLPFTLSEPFKSNTPRQDTPLLMPIQLGDSTCGKATEFMMAAPPTISSSDKSEILAPLNGDRTLSDVSTTETRSSEIGVHGFSDSYSHFAILRGEHHDPDPTVLSDAREVKMPILRGHDLRVKLTTTKMLSKGDDLYDTACPEGLRPITVDQRSGRPSPTVNTKAAQKIVSAKKLIEYRVFQVDNTRTKFPHIGSTNNNSSSYSTGSIFPQPPAVLPVSASSSPLSTRTKGASISSPEDPFGDRNLQKRGGGGGKGGGHMQNSPCSNSNNSVNKEISGNPISLNLTAVLSKYQYFGGEALEEAESLVDLTVTVDCSPLIRYLKERSGKAAGEVGESVEVMRVAVDKWLGEVLENVLQISERIEAENASQLNSESEGGRNV